MRVRHFSWNKRSDSSGLHETAVINCDVAGLEIQVSESPAGRSVQINVRDSDGWKKVYP